MRLTLRLITARRAADLIGCLAKVGEVGGRADWVIGVLVRGAVGSVLVSVPSVSVRGIGEPGGAGDG
jgi:hypothetical protein